MGCAECTDVGCTECIDMEYADVVQGVQMWNVQVRSAYSVQMWCVQMRNVQMWGTGCDMCR